MDPFLLPHQASCLSLLSTLLTLYSYKSLGKLAANTRDIRKKLKEKSRMLGRFPNDFHITQLRGKKRLEVLDIDEFNTSKNFSNPCLPSTEPLYPIKNVHDIYAVVAYKGKLSGNQCNHCLNNSYTLSTCIEAPSNEKSTVLNRDVNACRNMAIIFLSIVAGLGRPKRFCRSQEEMNLNAAILGEAPPTTDGIDDGLNQ